MSEREIIRFENKSSLSRDAAYRFTALALQTHLDNRPFRVALAGGSTPAQLYSLLATPTFRDTIMWPEVHLFFGDERCAPPDSPESNYRMAEETLLSRIPLPDFNIHRMKGEDADPDRAARNYEEAISNAFALSPGELPRFDLILLGMGRDGHCASLFPHKASLQERERLVVAAEPGLEPFVPRLTLTFPVINNAANVLFLIAGADKAEMVQRVVNRQGDPEEIPSLAVQPTIGILTFCLDKDAAKLLG